MEKSELGKIGGNANDRQETGAKTMSAREHTTHFSDCGCFADKLQKQIDALKLDLEKSKAKNARLKGNHACHEDQLCYLCIDETCIKQLEADLAAKEKERLLAIKETADAVADVAVLRVKREVDKYEVDVLKADLAAAKSETEEWKARYLREANVWDEWKQVHNKQLSETKAKLEEAERGRLFLIQEFNDSKLKLAGAIKLLDKYGCHINHGISCARHCLCGYEAEKKAFLGEIGGR